MFKCFFRTPSNYGDETISSTCSLNVAKGEEAPKLSRVGGVSGVAHKECNWKVPYKVGDQMMITTHGHGSGLQGGGRNFLAVIKKD